MGYRDYDEKTRLPPVSRCKQYPSSIVGANSSKDMILGRHANRTTFPTTA